MTRRMLIDSSHAEQTRVVIMEGNTLLEYDSELSSQRNLKGNIYLAKITRVEPSLQAAFVDYGGNRHGFLPFSEIHPDYYRIPVADREALLAEQARARGPSEFDDDDEDLIALDGEEPEFNGSAALDADEDAAAYADHDDEGAEAAETDGDSDAADSDDQEGDSSEGRSRQRRNGRGRSNGRKNGDDSRSEQDRRRGARLRRSYSIQEVVKRGQIMLVQVVKEERGTKGAAVTTYLSLAGRYCVLMPNTARGGGISRKITVGKDRKRLKTIVDSLSIPGGMAVIVRTAGIGRTKLEIKRDFDYLAKTWEQIREVTLQSRAPALIYEESQLIKRVLRDSYTREIEEVLIQGDTAYREAKDFMKTLMPSHAKRVQPYKHSSPPLFHRFQVDAQLEHLHSPIVQLRSGGYLVINLTEALVAIDVNSGRSTRERHIEETALKTNLEAAEEIARQLRLRDLAGLIVVDFIDMEDRRNNAAVERKFKDALRTDRARVQTGRISSLGLLEMSRQRLRPSILETMMQTCPHCSGTGRIHSTATSALHVLRALEDHGLRGNAGIARVSTPPDVAFYILNDKRDELVRFERDYNLYCRFEPDATLTAPDMRVEMLERSDAPNFVVAPLPPPLPVDEQEADVEEEQQPEKPAQSGGQQRKGRRNAPEAEDEGESGDASNRRRGRRGGRRRRRDEDEKGTVEASGPAAPPAAEEADQPAAQPSARSGTGDDEQDSSSEGGRSSRGNRRRRRRRSRPEGRSLPGVAVFARAATPLAFHVASGLEDEADGQDRQGDSQEQQDRQAESQDQQPEAAPEAPAPKPKPKAKAKPRARSKAKAQPDAKAQPEVQPETQSETPPAGMNGSAAHWPEPDAPAAEPDERTPEPAEAGSQAEPSRGEPETAPQEEVASQAEGETAEAPAQPEPERQPEPAMAEEASAPGSAESEASPSAQRRPRRRGWWQRLLE